MDRQKYSIKIICLFFFVILLHWLNTFLFFPSPPFHLDKNDNVKEKSNKDKANAAKNPERKSGETGCIRGGAGEDGVEGVDEDEEGGEEEAAAGGVGGGRQEETDGGDSNKHPWTRGGLGAPLPVGM